jgi:hypothetical protein
MTVLSFPSDVLAPSSLTLDIVANTQSGGKSPFDGTEQTLEMPGAAWMAKVTFENLQNAEWRSLLSFLVDLGGKAGRFTWAPPFTRQGTATGGHINGAGQTGKSLVTAGWGGTGYAARNGDLIGWTDPTGRPALHIVTADATPSGGACTLAIAPAIRRPPADATALALTAPVALWRLADDTNGMDWMTGDFGNFQNTFVEAIF